MDLDSKFHFNCNPGLKISEGIPIACCIGIIRWLVFVILPLFNQNALYI